MPRTQKIIESIPEGMSKDVAQIFIRVYINELADNAKELFGLKERFNTGLNDEDREQCAVEVFQNMVNDFWEKSEKSNTKAIVLMAEEVMDKLFQEYGNE